MKPTKLIKGHGLAKLLAESNFRALGINNLHENEGCIDIDEFDDQIATIGIEEKFALSDWYKEIMSYLLKQKQ